MMDKKGYDSICQLLDGEGLDEDVGYNFFIGHCQSWFMDKNLEKLPQALLKKLSGIKHIPHIQIWRV